MTRSPLRRCPAFFALAAAVLLAAPAAMAAAPPASSRDTLSSSSTLDHGHPGPPADTSRQVERFQHQLERSG
ncbi:hypothetical protein ACU686_09395 [Yinghuangia aomiensis]